MSSIPSSKTRRDAEPFNCVSPVNLPESPATTSSKINLTGPPRVARDIVAELFNNIQKWNKNHNKGAKLIIRIVQLKCDNLTIYPGVLENLANDLSNIVDNLEDIFEELECLLKNMKSLIRRHKQSGPLFTTLSNDEMTNLAQSIVDAYKEEYQTKEFASDVLVRAGSKNEVMYYARMWSDQHYITSEINFKLETLLTKTEGI